MVFGAVLSMPNSVHCVIAKHGTIFGVLLTRYDSHGMAYESGDFHFLEAVHMERNLPWSRLDMLFHVAVGREKLTAEPDATHLIRYASGPYKGRLVAGQQHVDAALGPRFIVRSALLPNLGFSNSASAFDLVITRNLAERLIALAERLLAG